VLHGPLNKQWVGRLTEMNTRELVVIAPLMVLILLIGIWPAWIIERDQPGRNDVVLRGAGCRRLYSMLNFASPDHDDLPAGAGRAGDPGPAGRPPRLDPLDALGAALVHAAAGLPGVLHL
jgi:hypothetical protein